MCSTVLGSHEREGIQGTGHAIPVRGVVALINELLGQLGGAPVIGAEREGQRGTGAILDSLERV
jgi:hypothetical protein